MIRIKDIFLERSKLNRGLLVMIVVDENGQKWVVSGDHKSYLIEYEKSIDTRESNLFS